MNMNNMDMISKGGHIAILAFFCLMAVSAPGLCNVVINEVELSAPHNESVWVELYNTGEAPVDLTGWVVEIEDGAWKGTIPLGGIIDPLGFKVAEGEDTWVTTGNGTVNLYDALGEVVDRASPQNDQSHTYFTYGRIPDGKRTGTSADWALLRGSRGMSNGMEVQA